jgi:hypothetical protein
MRRLRWKFSVSTREGHALSEHVRAHSLAEAIARFAMRHGLSPEESIRSMTVTRVDPPIDAGEIEP